MEIRGCKARTGLVWVATKGRIFGHVQITKSSDVSNEMILYYTFIYASLLTENDIVALQIVATERLILSNFEPMQTRIVLQRSKKLEHNDKIQ